LVDRQELLSPRSASWGIWAITEAGRDRLYPRITGSDADQ
jgi:hypothetical protein